MLDAHDYPQIDPLALAWVRLRTFKTFQMTEAVLHQRNRGAYYITPPVVQRMVDGMLAQPMPWDFTWDEYDRLMGP